MATVNKVILIGNLGADPEMRHTPTGDAVCNLRIATSDKRKDKATGEVKDSVEWHRIALYRRLAEIAGEYLKKGASVYIEGRLRTRSWKDREGQERSTTEIEATELKMLGSRAPRPDSVSISPPDALTPGGGRYPFDDDEIPF